MDKAIGHRVTPGSQEYRQGRSSETGKISESDEQALVRDELGGVAPPPKAIS